jgi:transposase
LCKIPEGNYDGSARGQALNPGSCTFQQALRLRALRGCQLGFSETELAELLGLSRETVCHWWSAYADGGLDALPHDRSGSRRVSKSQRCAASPS